MEKITWKNLANNMKISERTSKRYMKDIKKHYDIKVITQFHVDDYFKIPA